MARVDQVEAAVGEADAQPLPPPYLGPLAQLFRLYDLRLDAQQVAMPQRLRHLARVRHRRADLADDDAGGDVGELGRISQRGAGRQARRQRGGDRVARARHVEHLACLSRKRVRRTFGIDQHHAIPAEGDEHRPDTEAPRQAARALGLLARPHLSNPPRRRARDGSA